MSAIRPIEFDAYTLYNRAAFVAVRTTLVQSHGEAFADEFVTEHGGAIQRAAMTRLNGRQEGVVRIELQALRRISQVRSQHE